MYGKIKSTKIHNILWMFIYLLPMLFIGSYVLVNTKSGSGAFIGASDYLDNISSIIVSIMPENWLVGVFKNIIQVFTQSTSSLSPIENIILINCYWFVLVCCLHLAIDFVLLIPNICSKFMEKLGGAE